jgi:hypothetical protein
MIPIGCDAGIFIMAASAKLRCPIIGRHKTDLAIQRERS